ncbi:DMT family transporter [Nocardia goodfellowii]|uniref:Drug/metabolite transporter (DMT)-like permease n=1 Tax=Nocardia goodfellowii TaxID=882446 RepID=A0ABS4QKI0_9NOCA|nr:DMT family transporter [Nocardia goodfellowii]MBP2192214.1 drug/metabolite transporter (DMT)-like permease [Nocardia goodfellowii]
MKAHFTIAMQPLFVLMWSSAFIAGIVGVGAAPPMLVLLARYAIAGALLLLYAYAVGARWPRGNELRHVVIAGLLMQIVQYGAFYTAMSQDVSAAIIALVQGLNPVVIALFAGFLGETVTARQWAGFGIGGLGVALAVAGQASFSATGLLLCVIGLLGLSIGTVYQKRYVPQVDSRASTAVHTVASAPIAAVLVISTGQFQIWDLPRFAASMTWMVLVTSMGAFLLLNAMLRRWDATRVGRLFFATPAVTALLAWLVIDQPLRPLTIAGLGVGLIGLVLASHSRIIAERAESQSRRGLVSPGFARSRGR